MKKKYIFTLFIAILILGVQSCAQSMCAAYTQVDDNKEKKEKKEGRF